MIFYFWAQHANWKRIERIMEIERDERKELNSRLMARSLGEFVQGEVAEEAVKNPPEPKPEYPYNLNEVGI